MSFDPKLELYARLDLFQDIGSIVRYLSSIKEIEEATYWCLAGISNLE